MTASAVSQQLGKLEREVGQKLLERQGRGVRLTDAAELLVQYTERILSLVASAEADLESKRGVVLGNLTIAAFATAARELVPPTLRFLRGEHPALTIGLREMEPDDALPLVRRGNLDVAVVDTWRNAPPVVSDGLIQELLLTDCADIALPADHRLADRRSVDLAELGEQPWISWPRGSMCHEWLISTLRGIDIEPRIAHTAMEHGTQLALVAAGLGASVLPRLGRGPLPDNVSVVPVRPALVRQVFAIWRRDATRRPSIAALVAALRAQAASSETERVSLTTDAGSSSKSIRDGSRLPGGSAG